MSDPSATRLTGFRRSDGRLGIRNLVAVMAAADNVNPLARRIAAAASGVVCLPASYGRGQLGEDLEITLATMAGLAGHPNVASCLVVSFEPASAERIAERVEAAGRKCHCLSLLSEGGVGPTLEKARRLLDTMTSQAQRAEREPGEPADFVVGLECGGSDTTSGLFGNPSLGHFADQLLNGGGSAIFSEPVECLGGEQAIAARARTPQAGSEMVAAIQRFRAIALSQGVDLTGINPTADNIAGGLTTIEEKSLGALAKTGTRPIEGLLGYGAPPPGRGLWFMDAPAAAVENLTALAGAGAQVAFFVTGSGNPIGHPLATTIKICANPETVRRMGEHIDVDLSGGLCGEYGIAEAAARIGECFAATVNGRQTAAERLGYLETNISRFGLSV